MIQRFRKFASMLTFILLLSLTLVLAGCNYEANSPTRGSQGQGDWLVQVWASEICGHPGDTLTVRGTVTNTGSQKLATADLHNQFALDIVITDGKRTGRWSDGKTLTPDLTHLELGPHESKTIEMQWQVDSSDIVRVETDFIVDPADSAGPVAAHAHVFVEEPCNSGFGY